MIRLNVYITILYSIVWFIISMREIESGRERDRKWERERDRKWERKREIESGREWEIESGR